MSNFEAALRELAQTAIDLDAYWYGEYNCADRTIETRVRQAEQAVKGSIDPRTALLVADVIEWARITAKISEDELGPVLMLRKAIAELDMHSLEKNGETK